MKPGMTIWPGRVDDRRVRRMNGGGDLGDGRPVDEHVADRMIADAFVDRQDRSALDQRSPALRRRLRASAFARRQALLSRSRSRPEGSPIGKGARRRNAEGRPRRRPQLHRGGTWFPPLLIGRLLSPAFARAAWRFREKGTEPRPARQSTTGVSADESDGRRSSSPRRKAASNRPERPGNPEQMQSRGKAQWIYVGCCHRRQPYLGWDFRGLSNRRSNRQLNRFIRKASMVSACFDASTV